jgi:hypothetical protein
MHSFHSKIALVNVFILFLLSGCGLKYVPPETPEAFELRRHQIVEDHVRKGLMADSASFTAVAFSETKVIKPASFRSLDSLYEIKYRNEQKGIYDKELDNIIIEQREAVKRDTVKVKYLENIIFTFDESKDSTLFVNMNVLLDHELTVVDENVNSTILIPQKKIENYKRYLFEESFMYPGSMATSEETAFYQFYKEKTFNMPKNEQDEMVLHTLKIMDAAYTKKTLQTSRLINYLSLVELRKIYPDITNEKYSEVYTILEKSEDGNEAVKSYWVTVTFDLSNSEIPIQYYFRYDTLLRTELIQKL